MTDNLYADAREQSLEIEILRADLAGTKAEWFKQQREWAVREQDYARKLAAAELRADAFRDALRSAVKRFDNADEGTLHVRDGVAWAMARDARLALAQAKEGL